MNKRTRDRILNQAMRGPTARINLAPLRRVVSQPFKYSHQLAMAQVLLVCGHTVDWYGEERYRRRCLKCYESPDQLELF